MEVSFSAFGLTCCSTDVAFGIHFQACPSSKEKDADHSLLDIAVMPSRTDAGHCEATTSPVTTLKFALSQPFCS